MFIDNPDNGFGKPDPINFWTVNPIIYGSTSHNWELEKKEPDYFDVWKSIVVLPQPKKAA